MSRIREILLYDANGDPIVLDAGRLPVYLDEKEVVITGLDGSTLVSVGATADNALKVSDATTSIAISEGLVTGKSLVFRSGLAPDYDEGDGWVTTWDGADDGGVNAMQYTYSTTAAIDSVSSSSTADTQEITVIGLDTNWSEVTQTITLNGQTRVALATSLIRCYRAYNSTTGALATDLVGTVTIYENTTLSGGLPTDVTKIRAIIKGDNNQTLMAVYTVPAGKTAYFRDWFTDSAGRANKIGVAGVKVVVRRFEGVFRVIHIAALIGEGTSATQYVYTELPSLPEKTDVEIRVATDTAGTAVAAGFSIILLDNSIFGPGPGEWGN